MTAKEALAALTLKFSSGNNIQVERATILREEFDAIQRIVADFIAEREVDEWLEANH